MTLWIWNKQTGGSGLDSSSITSYLILYDDNEWSYMTTTKIKTWTRWSPYEYEVTQIPTLLPTSHKRFDMSNFFSLHQTLKRRVKFQIWAVSLFFSFILHTKKEDNTNLDVKCDLLFLKTRWNEISLMCKYYKYHSTKICHIVWSQMS